MTNTGEYTILSKSAAEALRSSYRLGGIAQLGERLNGIQEVSGSIPLISTISKRLTEALPKRKYFIESLRDSTMYLEN